MQVYPGRKITGLLAEIDRKPEDLDAILITHEHSDHIHGVGVLARKYGMDLYANEATWKAMEGSKYLGKVDDSQKHLFEMGKTLTSGIWMWKVLVSAMMQLLHSSIVS